MYGKVTWIKLTIFFASFIFVTGCCGPRAHTLTPFPSYRGFVESDKPAVLSHDSRNKTYVITERGLNNAVVNQIYIDAIHNWKRENNIK
jgi:hypothetical protein